MNKLFQEQHALYPQKNRDKNILPPIITEHVREGSIRYTDSWPAYTDGEKYGYSHCTVNYKKKFVDLLKRKNTQLIEPLVREGKNGLEQGKLGYMLRLTFYLQKIY